MKQNNINIKKIQKIYTKAAIKLVQHIAEEAVKDEVDYAAKKIIANNIRREVYNRDFGGSKNLRVSDFNKPENLKSYISTQQYNENSQIHLTIRNETPPSSIFNSPIHSDYPGILGYWIEVGSIPVLWDNGNSQYVNKTFKFTDKNGVEHTIMKAFPPRPWMEESRKEANNGKLVNAFKEGMKRNGLY